MKQPQHLLSANVVKRYRRDCFQVPSTNAPSVLLQLRERNFVERIRHKWWDERSKCPKPRQSKTGNTKRLDLNNMAGVFLVLFGGVIISLVLVVFEIRCKKMVEYFTSGQVILPGSRKAKCFVCIWE